ncbi:MAG TPA: dihydroorotase [Steroidobacteraceae bacterium]|jgi:dihydroorotase|nr:dihydroorotase [Steroidobacteraceae bacterium]
MKKLTLARPDDWHVHLRDGALLRAVVAFSARRFGRAIVMPNLNPPITTVELARAYRDRILAALPRGARFEPLMTLYLTDQTPPEEIDRAKASGIIHGIKLYPAGATTHSGAGVTDIAKVYAVLARMEELGVPLLVHGETPSAEVDVFDREAHYIDRSLAPAVSRFARLKVVVEHITTAHAVEFVERARDGVGATITPQHLLHNRNALFAGGIRPHYYCLPILKRERDREALAAAATGGSPRFFLGTDSAPHDRAAKENGCGCAGMFTAHAALELYAEAFEAAGRLDRLEDFASHFGADFYGLPRHAERITLVKDPWTAPADYPFGDGTLVPYRAGEPIAWRVAKTDAADPANSVNPAVWT